MSVAPLRGAHFLANDLGNCFGVRFDTFAEDSPKSIDDLRTAAHPKASPIRKHMANVVDEHWASPLSIRELLGAMHNRVVFSPSYYFLVCLGTVSVNDNKSIF